MENQDEGKPAQDDAPGLLRVGDLTADGLRDSLDRFANLDPPLPRWLGGDNADAGQSYCRPCAEEAVAEGKGEFVDGGWSRSEEDSCCHCETCGCILDYYLTVYGAIAELSFFKDERPLGPFSKDDAFHLARLVEAMPEDDGVLDIARKAIELLGEKP